MLNIEVESQIVNPESVDDDTIHVVAAIIWSPQIQSQFLIARRQEGKHLEHYWELPGGKVEGSESPKQALKRELKEEVDIVMSDAEPHMQVLHRYPDRTILLDVWMVRSFSGMVKALEQQQLAWISVTQIDQYLFPAADIPILESIKNNGIKET